MSGFVLLVITLSTYFLVVLGFELKASQLLHRQLPLEPQLKPFFFALVTYQVGSCVFARVGLKP
jgi:hypothetical protein